MIIPVYIISSGDPESSYVAKLSALFDCGYFEVSVIRCEDEDCNRERKAILYSLNNARDTYCDSPCIIVKDCMFSNLSGNDMYNLIKSIVEDQCEWDICYLARYLDRCDGKIVLPDITTGGSLVTSNLAEGDDAIMYSPKARDLLMNLLSEHHHSKTVSDVIYEQIKDEKLRGVATSPPVINYNPVFGDMQKTWECDGKHKHPEPSNESTCAYAWLPILLLFIIIIVLILWFFFCR